MSSSKTLYISDLDGTLLQGDVALSDYTVKTLNALSAKGIYLSAATARTAATVRFILAGSGINVPAVLMNGVCIYDTVSGEYVKSVPIADMAKRKIIDAVHENDLAGFFYTIDGNELSTFYENLNSPGADAFVEERVRRYGKVFTNVKSFDEIAGRNIVYFSVSDYEHRLSSVARELENTGGLRVEYYRDIYEKDCFFLEASAAAASKKTAVDFLRREYGFDRIVGFGDNYNDIPLLEACDEFYAVANAVDAVKEKATGVIGANYEDGVAHFLEELL